MIEINEDTMNAVSQSLANAKLVLRAAEAAPANVPSYTTVPSVSAAFSQHVSLFSGQPGSMTGAVDYLGRQIQWLSDCFTEMVKAFQLQETMNAMAFSQMMADRFAQAWDEVDIPMPARDMSTINDLLYTSPIPVAEALTPLQAA